MLKNLGFVQDWFDNSNNLHMFWTTLYKHEQMTDVHTCTIPISSMGVQSATMISLHNTRARVADKKGYLRLFHSKVYACILTYARQCSFLLQLNLTKRKQKHQLVHIWLYICMHAWLQLQSITYKCGKEIAPKTI